MKPMEFAKGRSRVLAISMAPATTDAMGAELNQAKEAILQWKAKHNEHCDMLMLTVVSAPENHTAIERMLKEAYREPTLSQALGGVEVQVMLLNSNGKTAKEYHLGDGRAKATAKPWWKFW